MALVWSPPPLKEMVPAAGRPAARAPVARTRRDARRRAQRWSRRQQRAGRAGHGVKRESVRAAARDGTASRAQARWRTRAPRPAMQAGDAANTAGAAMPPPTRLPLQEHSMTTVTVSDQGQVIIAAPNRKPA